MSKIFDFIKKLKLPIFWTLGYIFCLWAIFHILFNFELFSAHNWIRVSRAHLHGFGGFTFSLMTLAAIPLYIATLAIVIRTQKPIIALPVPKCVSVMLEKIFPKQKTDEQTESAEPEQNESVSESDIDQELNNIPAEMRGVFLRARAHPNRVAAPICSVCSVTPNVYPTAPESPSEPTNDMPLPPDFDFGTDTEPLPSAPTSGVPIFQDINLYDENESVDDTDDTESAELIDNAVTEHLTKTNREFNILDDDLILTNDMIIAIHDDPDFWIMDEPTWFAAGKTRESPIPELLKRAKKHHVEPVLYLGTTNIMKFDDKCAAWKKSGIRVITDITEL